jgi:hypothetical protein
MVTEEQERQQRQEQEQIATRTGRISKPTQKRVLNQAQGHTAQENRQLDSLELFMALSLSRTSSHELSDGMAAIQPFILAVHCSPRFREPNPQVQWTWPLSPPSNLVGIASGLANLVDLAIANLLRDL